jgi:hypothetical protein
MQNTSKFFVDYTKIQIEHEKRKKEEILKSSFFKLLEKNNKIECDRLMRFIEDKTADEIENIIKFIINKKSVQKINF